MKDPIDYLIDIKDPDQMFDLICFHNYVHGDLKLKMPVGDSRRVFEQIKKLLKKKVKKNGNKR